MNKINFVANVACGEPVLLDVVNDLVNSYRNVTLAFLQSLYTINFFQYNNYSTKLPLDYFGAHFEETQLPLAKLCKSSEGNDFC